jgi:hypothetical protein
MNSLELIQSRHLLAIFEIGHGMSQSAYISMGATVRAAVALGFDDVKPNNLQDFHESQGKVGETKRTWWGIMVIDSYAALSTVCCCCQSSYDDEICA